MLHMRSLWDVFPRYFLLCKGMQIFNLSPCILKSDDDIEDNLLSKTIIQSSNTLICSGDSRQPFNKSELQSSDSAQTRVDLSEWCEEK